jgi:hypothetical protein
MFDSPLLTIQAIAPHTRSNGRITVLNVHFSEMPGDDNAAPCPLLRTSRMPREIALSRQVGSNIRISDEILVSATIERLNENRGMDRAERAAPPFMRNFT